MGSNPYKPGTPRFDAWGRGHDDMAALRQRIAALERERDHLARKTRVLASRIDERDAAEASRAALVTALEILATDSTTFEVDHKQGYVDLPTFFKTQAIARAALAAASGEAKE